MSYDDKKKSISSEPFSFVELVVDSCPLTHGVAPCTATQTGDAKCFNTIQTCNDLDNYEKGEKAYRFCESRENIPVGENMIPAIIGKVNIASNSITSGRGLGNRFVAKVQIKDFPYHDRGVDKYVSERTYDPMKQGTYWGKWLKRNEFYEGRTMRHYYGFLGGEFDINNFKSEVFELDSIDASSNGKVAITAKDILTKTYKEKSQYPVASNGELSAAISDADTAFTVTPAGVGDEYATGGTLIIGEEVMLFQRVNDLFLVNRGDWDTTAVAHDLGDTVQQCVPYNDQNVLDVLYDLLVNGAKIPAGYIPYGNPGDNWDEEKEWLSTSNVYGILTKPEEVKKVIAELTEQFLFDVWWNAEEQKVFVRAISPDRGGETPTLSYATDIIEDSVQVKYMPKERLTQITIFYNKIDYTDNEDTRNFSSILIQKNSDIESADRLNAVKVKTIKSRWMRDGAQALQLAGKLLNRYSFAPEEIKFSITRKDDSSVRLGELINVNAWQLQDARGADEPRKFQVTSIVPDAQTGGEILHITAKRSFFSGRYWKIAPNGLADYSSATDEQRAQYGFVGYNGTYFPDGEPNYKII